MRRGSGRFLGVERCVRRQDDVRGEIGDPPGEDATISPLLDEAPHEAVLPERLADREPFDGQGLRVVTSARQWSLRRLELAEMQVQDLVTALGERAR